MKNIVLLGASNSQMMGGFKEAFYRDDVKFNNLSTGGMGTLAKLYELKRPRNEKILVEADLIIIETNIIDYHDEVFYEGKYNTKQAHRCLAWLGEELFILNKKILFLFLALPDDKKARSLCHLYRSICKDYGFNMIDVFSYYKKAGVQDFYITISDWGHQLYALMQAMGKNIIENLDSFSFPKKHSLKKENPIFEICSIEEMMDYSKVELEGFYKKDFFYDEKTYRLTRGGGGGRLYFPPKFEGFVPVLVHSYSMDKKTRNYPVYETASSVILKNSKQKVIKPMGICREQNPIITPFVIDENSYLCFNDNNEEWSEKSHIPNIGKTSGDNLDYADLIDFLLAKGGKWEYDEPSEDFVELEEGYDFSHLIPDCVLIKTAIEQYCERMDPVKFASLQNENASLKASLEDFKSVHYSAKARIHSHLAYKLGSAMIKHSKSFKGYLKMPFVLLALRLVHKENLNTTPQASLESYPDYAEALREQNCLTYKLGLALMRANKTWYKGGYVRLIFEVRGLKREFKKANLRN